MINRHRGETALMVDGEALPMRLTLGALAELEQAFSVDSLPALGERFAGGRLSARDVTRILAAGLRGAGSSVSEDQVAGLAFDGGLNGAIRAAIALLDATFGGADESAPEAADTARPPRPPAA
ncbi:gene transfer agent family protein [Bosea sp. (in: a-proteobacteria)]|uniref:gene transfer agent family protein n=1 Tax=Bosea sp. (in: a-proteobacteria) TaxID=1871050 RepID=UPI0027354EEE|nr:gene transfer agent family protein [Bosea sp. (in: a-proteobacteria)]MDP3410232.1 gene transfer agent family protein [Bosea sp. (in: a-proteobacteria)]